MSLIRWFCVLTRIPDYAVLGKLARYRIIFPAYANGVAPALAEMASVILGADPVGPVAVMTRLD